MEPDIMSEKSQWWLDISPMIIAGLMVLGGIGLLYINISGGDASLLFQLSNRGLTVSSATAGGTLIAAALIIVVVSLLKRKRKGQRFIHKKGQGMFGEYFHVEIYFDDRS
jgi:hypothetical protein